MLRVVATVVLPLLLPTALYFAWLWAARSLHGGEVLRAGGLPWLWLGAAGAVLLAVVLFVVTVGFGTARQGIYVPPRWENGRIVPAHVEPEPGR
jgi:hypothetical protein